MAIFLKVRRNTSGFITVVEYFFELCYSCALIWIGNRLKWLFFSPYSIYEVSFCLNFLTCVWVKFWANILRKVWCQPMNECIQRTLWCPVFVTEHIGHGELEWIQMSMELHVRTNWPCQVMHGFCRNWYVLILKVEVEVSQKKIITLVSIISHILLYKVLYMAE